MMTLIFYLGKSRIKKKLDDDQENALLAMCFIIDGVNIMLGYYLHMAIA